MSSAPQAGPGSSGVVLSGVASSEVLEAAANARRLAVHWRKTRLATGAFLGVWILATFGVGIFARQLEQIHFFGWPLSYYMGAQGSLIIFLLIIGGYAVLMRRLDGEAQGGAEAAEAGTNTADGKTTHSPLDNVNPANANPAGIHLSSVHPTSANPVPLH